MDGQFAVPFHFAVEFLVLVVVIGAAFDAARARKYGAGAWAIVQGLGFTLLAAVQLAHGAQFPRALQDGAVLVVGLRTAGFVLLAVAARPAAGVLPPVIIGAGAIPALFLPGVDARFAFASAVAALAVAARGVREHRSDQDPITFAFASAFVMFAVAEGAIAIAPSGGGALVIFAHVARALAAVFLARWLWASIVRSIRMRFVASFVVMVTIAALLISGTLNLIIANTLRDGAFNRLTDAGRARVATMDNLGRNTMAGLFIFATNDSIAASLATAKADSTTANVLARVLPPDFLVLIGSSGRVLGSAQHVRPEGKPDRVDRMPRNLELQIAGRPVVAEALSGRANYSPVPLPFTDAKGTPHTQVAVLAAFPARRNGSDTVVGAIVAGYRIAGEYLAGLRRDVNAEATLLVGGRVEETTYSDVPAITKALSGLESVLKIARESDSVVTRVLSLGGEDLLTVIVPIKSTDGQVVGQIALSERRSTLAGAQGRITRSLFLMTLLAICVAAVLAWLLGGGVTRPIRALTAASRQLREGNLEARARVTTIDEVGSLGNAFNEMAVELQLKTGSLRSAAEEEASLRARMEAILQSMGDGLIATDVDGSIVIFNAAAERMFGRPAERTVGKAVGAVVTGTGTGGRPLADVAMKDGSIDGIVRPARGAPIHVTLTSTPLLDAARKPAGRVIVLRDVSREYEAERMKTEFLSNVSHELRTPITPIKGYAEIMTRKNFPREKMIEFLEGILQSSARLERIVEILVDVAAMEAGRLKPRPEHVDVGVLVDAAIARGRARNSSHRFVRKVAAGLPPVIGDDRLLGRSLDELIDNAVKFSPDGGKIEISAEPEFGSSRARRPGMVAFTVRDQGIGIEPENLADLFKDFRQVDGSETRAYGGLGLGLAYVRRIVAVHGGEVTVQSTPNRGSAFRVVLPTADARSTPARMADDSTPTRSNGRTTGAGRTTSGTLRRVAARARGSR